MLPIEMIKIMEFHEATLGSVGWSKNHRNQTFVVGKRDSKKLIVSMDGEQIWATDVRNMSGSGAFVEEIDFKVDPASFAIFDHLEFEKRLGALLFVDGNIFLCVPSQNGHDLDRIAIGNCDLEGANNSTVAFTRWQAVAHADGAPQVLIER